MLFQSKGGLSNPRRGLCPLLGPFPQSQSAFLSRQGIHTPIDAPHCCSSLGESWSEARNSARGLSVWSRERQFFLVRVVAHAPPAGCHELLFATHAAEGERTRAVTAAARATSIVCTPWQQTVTLRARSHTAFMAERTATVRTHTPLGERTTPIARRCTRTPPLSHIKREVEHRARRRTHSQRLASHAPWPRCTRTVRAGPHAV